MASDAKSVQLKLFVDEGKKKVMFAEAEEDFVEILFSFMTLPLGTIARFLNELEDSNIIKLGSFTSIYKSVLNIDVEHFSGNWFKNALLNPFSSSKDLCTKLKFNLCDTNAGFKGSDRKLHNVAESVLFKAKGSFIITDDLNITPFVLDKNIQFLNNLDVAYSDLVERTIYFGMKDFFNLLKWSLYTNAPLTNLVFGLSSKPCLYASAMLSPNSTLSNPSPNPQTVKFLVQKSKKKVLCAQADNLFVELLLSFLTIPLGAVKRLTMDNHDSPVGINNLYNSISSLVDGNNLKTENVKLHLLDPKVSAMYKNVTISLPISADLLSTSICPVKAVPRSFIKKVGSFLVSDDLEITLSPSISSISKFTFGIPSDDIEVLELSIGERETLLLLKASLTTTSVLTHCLDAFSKS